jgi:hypothetical protein
VHLLWTLQTVDGDQVLRPGEIDLDVDGPSRDVRDLADDRL